MNSTNEINEEDDGLPNELVDAYIELEEHWQQHIWKVAETLGWHIIGEHFSAWCAAERGKGRPEAELVLGAFFEAHPEVRALADARAKQLLQDLDTRPREEARAMIEDMVAKGWASTYNKGATER